MATFRNEAIMAGVPLELTVDETDDNRKRSKYVEMALNRKINLHLVSFKSSSLTLCTRLSPVSGHHT